MYRVKRRLRELRTGDKCAAVISLNICRLKTNTPPIILAYIYVVVVITVSLSGLIGVLRTPTYTNIMLYTLRVSFLGDPSRLIIIITPPVHALCAWKRFVWLITSVVVFVILPRHIIRNGYLTINFGVLGGELIYDITD